MIGYKLFRKRKDGTYGPLFINKRLKLVPGTVYEAEDHPTKGYAHRPGWHVCSKPIAPHLRQGGDRVWCLVDFSRTATIDRPAAQGGIWYLGSFMMIIREFKTPTPEQLEALLAYKAKHGHYWKYKLLNAWLDGTDAREPNGHLLRQVRNRLGPSWLYSPAI